MITLDSKLKSSGNLKDLLSPFPFFFSYKRTLQLLQIAEGTLSSSGEILVKIGVYCFTRLTKVGVKFLSDLPRQIAHTFPLLIV